MNLQNKISELDQRFTVAEAISDDTFGNKRIAALKELNHNTTQKAVVVKWDVYTVDGSGNMIVAPNIINPYVAIQSANDSVRLNPGTGARVTHTHNDYSATSRADLETELDGLSLAHDVAESDSDLKGKLLAHYNQEHLNATISQYDYFIGAIKGEQARYFQTLRAYLLSDDAKGVI